MHNVLRRKKREDEEEKGEKRVRRRRNESGPGGPSTQKGQLRGSVTCKCTGLYRPHTWKCSVLC